MSDKAPIIHLSIGRGGWTGNHATVTKQRDWGVSRDTSRVSHYGDTWLSHPFASGAIAIDTTTVPDEHPDGLDIYTLAVRGPMTDPELPAGSVSKLSAGTVPFVDDGRFGNAGSFDHVSVDVMATIAGRFGARIFDPAAEAAAHRCRGARPEHTYCPCGRPIPATAAPSLY